MDPLLVSVEEAAPSLALDADVARTLTILVAARRERLAAEARNRAVLPEHAPVSGGRRASPQALPFTSADTQPDAA